MKNRRPTALEAWSCQCCGTHEDLELDAHDNLRLNFSHCTICAREILANEDPDDLECHCGYRTDAIYCICGWANQPNGSPSFMCERCGERIDH